MMRSALVALAALGACSPPASDPLPGASLAPHPSRVLATRACGDDIAFDGDASPDVHFEYTYDDAGRLVGEVGAYTAGGSETIALAYDNLGHQTHSLDTYADHGGSTETTADYDTLGDLVDYTYTTTSGASSDVQRYAMSAFTSTGQPTVEVLSETNQPDAHYVMAYDQLSRIVTAVRDGSSVTTYSYDDDGRTVWVDTDNGAFTGTIVYDANNNELMESWGGSDPSAIATQTTYTYDGSRLLGTRYERGTPLALLQTDTLRYCAK